MSAGFTLDYFSKLAQASNSLRSVAVTVGANTNQEITTLRGALPLVTLIFLTATANGNVQFKSGAAGNAAGATAITGAFPVTTTGPPLQISANGMPVLKGIKFGDSLYIVTTSNAAVVGHLMYFEAQK